MNIIVLNNNYNTVSIQHLYGTCFNITLTSKYYYDVILL